MLKLLKFTAKWCAPCRSMKPVLKQFCAIHPDVAFAEVDCDDPAGFALSKKLRVNALPTMIFVDAEDLGKKPKVLARWAGTCALEQLELMHWKLCPANAPKCGRVGKVPPKGPARRCRKAKKANGARHEP